MRDRSLRFWRRLQHLFRRNDLDQELDEELAFHRSMKQESAGADKVARDMGNVTRAKEDSREAWMFVGLETLLSDIRYALRVLQKAPVFTTCAVATLALGIGANTAIFTLIDALLLRNLPVPEADRMVQLAFEGQGERMAVFTYPLFEQIKQGTHSFSGSFTWNETELWTGWGAQAQRVVAAAASGEAYQTLQLVPQAGRLLRPADDTAASPRVAVISDRFWNRRYHRDAHAVGSTLLLDQQWFTIIGVTPVSFFGALAGTNPDITIPLHANAALHPGWHMLESTNNFSLPVFARLKPGVSEQTARAELLVLSPRLIQSLREAPAPRRRKRSAAASILAWARAA